MDHASIINFLSNGDTQELAPGFFISTHDEQHGRIEDRDYAVSEDAGWLVERHPYWKMIRSVGVAESGREVR
jgi:hypothetical protein